MTVNSLAPVTGAGFLGITAPAKPAAPAGQTAGSGDFATVLSSLASQTASAVKSAEDAAIKGIKGEAPVQDVVQSVMRAQTSLQTALAIRDKAVLAYQDLIKMPI